MTNKKVSNETLAILLMLILQLVVIILAIVVFKNIFYTPLWNHEIGHSGAVKGSFIKIPINSNFGRQILDSFNELFNNGKKISNYNIKEFMEEELVNSTI